MKNRIIKPKISKPSSFVIKTKSPRAYKREEEKATGLREAAESLTERWLMGKIPTNYYKEQMRLNQKEMERLSNSNIIKTYSVTMTEEELRLFSEFLEQREYSKEEEIELKKLRYENPDQYISRVSDYRRDKRNQGSFAKGLGIGALSGLGLGAGTGAVAYKKGTEQLDQDDWDKMYRQMENRGYTKEEIDSRYGDLRSASIKGGALLGGIGGIISGAAIGGTVGAAKGIHNKIKYRSGKTDSEALEISREKQLKKENPKEYQRIKSEQKDTISVMEGKMTKREFKEKHGHKPNTRI